MSDSSDKPMAVSRRKPQRRQRPRQTPKAGIKQVKSQQPQGSTVNGVKSQRLHPPLLPPQGGTYGSGVAPQRKIPPLQPDQRQMRTVRVPKKGLPKVHRRISPKTQLKPMARTILYGLRLLIVGVGIGAIVGTLLSILDPANRINSISSPANPPGGDSQPQSNAHPPETTSNLYLSQEITPLKVAVQNLVTANPTLTPGVFFWDLDNGTYIDINSTASFPAASTIKVPILIAFFQDVDAGKIRLDEQLTMTKEIMVGGSGQLQYQQAGSKYSAMEIVTKMITISDNTATNMLIARLGGKESLNQRFRTWGLTTTVIRNPLPDLEGTNTTSPRELGNLMAMLNQGNLVSMRSRDLMLDIMRRTQRDNLLPSGLGTEAEAYHKTGDIATMLADAGLIDVPTGKRYVAAVMVKRPNNDPRAEKLISSISKVAYQHFSQASVTSNNNTPVPPTIYQQPLLPPVIAPIPGINMNPVPPVGTYPSPPLNPQYYPPH